jgi:hypothetical protein
MISAVIILVVAYITSGKSSHPSIRQEHDISGIIPKGKHFTNIFNLFKSCFLWPHHHLSGEVGIGFAGFQFCSTLCLAQGLAPTTAWNPIMITLNMYLIGI